MVTTFRNVPLEEVAEINPRLDRSTLPPADTTVSFVPMAKVDEVNGEIATPESRPLRNVLKGFTAFREGDVLFAKITPCMQNGKSAIAKNLLNGLGFGSTEFHVLRPRPLVLPEWLRYFVRQPHFRREAQRNFTGTGGQQRVPVEFLRKAEIRLFSLVEQRRIVDILSCAEGIVRLRRRAAKLADEMIPSLFIKMFGDPVTNFRRWPTEALRDLVSFISGGTPSKARDDYWVGTLPWVSPKDMKMSEVFESIDHINDKVLTETNLKLIPIGAILIVVRGMILVHTVPVARAMAPLAINQDMKAMVPSSNVVSGYILWLLRVLQPHLLNMVATAAHGTRKLETVRLEELAIPLPPLAKQQIFADRVEQIRSIQNLQVAGTERAQGTFDALLAQVFSG